MNALAWIAQARAHNRFTRFTTRGLASVTHTPIPEATAAIAIAVADGWLLPEYDWLCGACSFTIATTSRPETIPAVEACERCGCSVCLDPEGFLSFYRVVLSTASCDHGVSASVEPGLRGCTVPGPRPG